MFRSFASVHLQISSAPAYADLPLGK